MKATISFEFELPEQQTEYDDCVNAQDALYVLREVDQLLRNQLKYGEPAGDREVLVEVRELLNQVVGD